MVSPALGQDLLDRQSFWHEHQGVENVDSPEAAEESGRGRWHWAGGRQKAGNAF